MLVSPQGYEAGRGNESAPLVNKQNNASGWAISSNRSCCRGGWFAVMSGDQRAGFLTAITSPLKTTYCMKCLFEKKKHFHTFPSLPIFTARFTTRHVRFPPWHVIHTRAFIFFFFHTARCTWQFIDFQPFIDCFVLTSRISWPAPL